MRHVELEHVEPRRLGHLRGADELIAHQVHVAPGHLPRDLAVREVRQRRRGQERPVALRQRLVDALPEPPRRAFPAGVGELERDARAGVPVDEVHDALPGVDVLGLVHPGAAGADPPLAAHVGHLGDDQRGAAGGAAAEVHEVPVVRGTVLRRVLAHRRHDDAVRQRELPEPERREHRRRRRARARAAPRSGGQLPRRTTGRPSRRTAGRAP